MRHPDPRRGRVPVDRVALPHEAGADAEQRLLAHHPRSGGEHAEAVVVGGVAQAADRQRPRHPRHRRKQEHDERRRQEHREQPRGAADDERQHRHQHRHPGGARQAAGEREVDKHERRGPARRMPHRAPEAPPLLRAAARQHRLRDEEQVDDQQHPGEGHPVREGATDPAVEIAVSEQILREPVERERGPRHGEDVHEPAYLPLAAEREERERQHPERKELPDLPQTPGWLGRGRHRRDEEEAVERRRREHRLPPGEPAAPPPRDPRERQGGNGEREVGEGEPEEGREGSRAEGERPALPPPVRSGAHERA
ncbi:MAG: hypothetical protein BWX64_02072 [Acidobacteria bacterium ADurb.Bin051]|nr:MAG: hypothetical protein BWX64_02072 [Acidobacteria bacterium ADurb.Bin051]